MHSITLPSILHVPHFFFLNQHAGEAKRLADSRWLSHGMANQSGQTTAIKEEQHVHSVHSCSDLETKAPAWPSQEEEQTMRQSWERLNIWVPSGWLPFSVHHTHLCTLSPSSADVLGLTLASAYFLSVVWDTLAFLPFPSRWSSSFPPFTTFLKTTRLTMFHGHFCDQSFQLDQLYYRLLGSEDDTPCANRKIFYLSYTTTWKILP